MKHHDASKLTQRWNTPADSVPAEPLTLADSLPDAEDRMGSRACLRSAADPNVLVYAKLKNRVSLAFNAEITGFSHGAPQFDGMEIGDEISFDESYIVRFEPGR